MSCFINLITDLTNNSEFNVTPLKDFNSFINKPNNKEYLNLSNFSLQSIKQVYEQFNNNEEIYFLNDKNDVIKVKNITKKPYKGKIYDVTVDNHIILVRRNNLTVWSGNSYNGTGGTVIDLSGNGNNGTEQGGLVWNSSGRYGGGFEFDGVDDYVDLNGTKIYINGSLSLSVWFKLRIKDTGDSDRIVALRKRKTLLVNY